MTSPPVPSLIRALGAVYRLHLLRLKRGRNIWLGVVSVALVVVTSLLARYAGQAAPRDVFRDVLAFGYFPLLVFLLPYLFSAGAIAEEVEARTFTYLAVRPVERAAIVLGKYLAGSTIALTLLLGSVLALHVGVYLPSPVMLVEALPDTLRALAALALLAAYYGAVCIVWGALLPEAAGVLSALHLGLVEFTFGYLMPGIFKIVSMNHVARDLAGLPRMGVLGESAPLLATGVGVGILASALVVALVVALGVVQVRELQSGRA